MPLPIWEIATVISISKLLIYLGIAMSIGGALILHQLSNHNALLAKIYRYSLFGIILTLASITIHFFIQVGAFSETGLSGMFDQDMMGILWDSNISDAIVMRIAGVIVLLANIICTNKNTTRHYWNWLLYIIAIALIGRSFSLIGHTVETPILIQSLLSLHVILISAWIGALWPLRVACEYLTPDALHRLMISFSRHAVIAVGILGICGLVVSYQLLNLSETSLSHVITTHYAQGLLVKLFFVLLILLIALFHKARLVPALLKQQEPLNDAPQKLSHSINREIIIAIIILFISAWLTTSVGPSHI